MNETGDDLEDAVEGEVVYEAMEPQQDNNSYVSGREFDDSDDPDEEDLSEYEYQRNESDSVDDAEVEQENEDGPRHSARIQI